MRKTSKELFKSVKIFILGILNTISDEIKKKLVYLYQMLIEMISNERIVVFTVTGHQQAGLVHLY